MSEADGKISLHGNRGTRSAIQTSLYARPIEQDARMHVQRTQRRKRRPPTGRWRARQSRPLYISRCGDRHAAVPASAPGRASVLRC